MGENVQVRKISMKPGKPLVDGTIGGVPFFGLPGNPAACLVSFEIFVRPALARMEGRPDGLLPRRRARIREDQRFPSGQRLQYLRGRVRFDDERAEYELQPLPAQSSNQLRSFAHANCLVELPPGKNDLTRGERVTVLLL